MSFPPFFSLKHQLINMSFSLLLLLLLLRFYGCYSCSFSSTLLLLVLPTSFPLIFSKIRQLIMAGSMEGPTPELKIGQELSREEGEIAKENKATQEEHVQLGEIVLSSECPSPENDKSVSDSSISDETLETSCCSPLEKLDSAESEEEASTEIVASDVSMSDDESLIEIALEHETNAVFQQEQKEGFLPELLPEFSPELLFRKHGLTELLSEINDEDNMIEIDIAMGSIKCSRLKIKA